MINRVRRSNYIPEGTGETSGFVVEDRSGRLVLDLGPGERRYLDGNQLEEQAAAFTVANDDAGKTFVFDAAASVIATLPKAAAANKGAKLTFVVGVLATSGTGHAVSPNAADAIVGNGYSGAVDKDAVCVVASDRIGDSLTVQSNGADAWIIVGITGTWTEEA